MGEERLNQDDEWRIGQKVQITAGPFNEFEGVITFINQKERLVRVMIDIFTRKTPVEVSSSSLKALDGE